MSCLLKKYFVLTCIFQYYEFGSSSDRENLEWGWDRWCQLQPKVGECNLKERIFYYDTQMDACREFIFSGCGGNQNAFSDKYECEHYCKGFGLILEASSLTPHESCSLQPNPGVCLAANIYYYYDVNDRKCKPFLFGGCGGNPNRFSEKEKCIETCGNID